MTDAAIEVKNVWKTFRIFDNRNTVLKRALLNRKKQGFKEFWALRNVSFYIPKGPT
jgi:ABC-type polysaccharide/polyol phosphate transport system ATPase subunit